MAKMTISEQKLNGIIAESIKKAINEIGDTRAGREMLNRASEKAFNQGRMGQRETFRTGLNDASRGAFGNGATYDTYQYTSKDGRNVCLKSDGTMRIGTADDRGRLNIIADVFEKEDIVPLLKTQDFRVARGIAKWCAERLTKPTHPIGEELYRRLSDWHTWAAQ